MPGTMQVAEIALFMAKSPVDRLPREHVLVHELYKINFMTGTLHVHFLLQECAAKTP